MKCGKVEEPRSHSREDKASLYRSASYRIRYRPKRSATEEHVFSFSKIEKPPPPRDRLSSNLHARCLRGFSSASILCASSDRHRCLPSRKHRTPLRAVLRNNSAGWCGLARDRSDNSREVDTAHSESLPRPGTPSPARPSGSSAPSTAPRAESPAQPRTSQVPPHEMPEHQRVGSVHCALPATHSKAMPRVNQKRIRIPSPRVSNKSIVRRPS